ncbi:PAS domain-containing protein, partial [bacterium]|nr:PAS domain-containing protein [bacterium]
MTVMRVKMNSNHTDTVSLTVGDTDRKELEEEVLSLRRRVDELEQSQRDLLATQKKLRESRERLRMAIDGSGGAEWEIELDPDNLSEPRAVWFSPRFKAMLGYEDDEMPNQMEAWKGVVHPKDVPRLQAITYKLLKKGYESDLSEFRFLHRDGSVRWLQATTKILRDEQNRPIRMIGVDWDIT